MRPYEERPSTLRAAGLAIPPGYKLNINGEIVPTGLFGSVGAAATGGIGYGADFASYGAENLGEDIDRYGAGGGGGGYQAPPRRELASSPEWLAYLNALGLEENTFRADIERQRGVVASDADRQIADLKPQYAQQRRGITGSLESRGMLRSGEFTRKLAESRAGEGRAQGGIRAGLTSQLSGLESSLANKMIDLGARRAQQELSMRGQGYY